MPIFSVSVVTAAAARAATAARDLPGAATRLLCFRRPREALLGLRKKRQGRVEGDRREASQNAVARAPRCPPAEHCQPMNAPQATQPRLLHCLGHDCGGWVCCSGRGGVGSQMTLRDPSRPQNATEGLREAQGVLLSRIS